MTVLRGFIASANAQYRKAGLGEYQMRVGADGSVTVPDRPAPEFKRSTPAGTAAPDQASAGAATQQSAAAAPAADANRAGAAPTFTSLKPTASGFAIRWDKVDGAKQYGIWIDGALVGHVPAPSFDGTIKPGTGGTFQVDAVRADGTRTPLTRGIRLDRTANGKLQVADGSGAGAA